MVGREDIVDTGEVSLLKISPKPNPLKTKYPIFN